MDAGTLSVARIGKHPLHPMMVPFPIAFLSAVPFTDIAYLRTRQRFWRKASWWLAAAGAACAVPTALAGGLDFMGIKKIRDHRAAWIHLIGNVAAVTITTANLSIRREKYNPVQRGLPLSAATLALLVITGWYGGELSYRHRIGVIPD